MVFPATCTSAHVALLTGAIEVMDMLYRRTGFAGKWLLVLSVFGLTDVSFVVYTSSEYKLLEKVLNAYR